ncbi:MAG TPA: transposase family protein, partial [Thermomicrobiales bacterium]|nr:transposase family protein [Thermomicrobiales bacterium]
LAAAAPPPPPAPRKVPRERYGEVARLCQRHTQAEVAAMLGVSQATVWRIVRHERGADAAAGP